VKVVLDTNVVVSGLLKPRSTPSRILRLILQGDMDIIINEHILAEYHEVLQRKKFSFNQKDIDRIIEIFRSYGIRAPDLLHTPRLPDPGDEPFLEAAISMQADALITGNKKHFPRRSCKGVSVMSPSEFLSGKTR